MCMWGWQRASCRRWFSASPGIPFELLVASSGAPSCWGVLKTQIEPLLPFLKCLQRKPEGERGLSCIWRLTSRRASLVKRAQGSSECLVESSIEVQVGVRPPLSLQKPHRGAPGRRGAPHHLTAAFSFTNSTALALRATVRTPLGCAITLSVGGYAHSSRTLSSSFLGPMGRCCPWGKVSCGMSVRTVTSNRQPGPLEHDPLPVSGQS